MKTAIGVLSPSAVAIAEPGLMQKRSPKVVLKIGKKERKNQISQNKRAYICR